MNPSLTCILRNTGLNMPALGAIHTAKRLSVTTMKIVTGTIGTISMKLTGFLRCMTIVAVATGFLTTAHAQTIKVDKDNRTIAVTASDKALADADLAVVHIGFQVFGADEQSTYASGSTISNSVSATISLTCCTSQPVHISVT